MDFTFVSLNEIEDKLKKYVPVVPRKQIKGKKDIEEFFNTYGGPVVVKGFSSHTTHKTEEGMVVMNVCNVKKAYEVFRSLISRCERVYVEKQLHGREIFVSFKYDVLYGNVLGFGSGGIDVELKKDVNYVLLPAEVREIEKLVLSTEIGYNIYMGAYRDVSLPFNELMDFILSLQKFYEKGSFIEMEINPACITSQGVFVVDFKAIEHKKK